jgi:primosomal protein N' (replication factor Y) (superfamily II helicase)
MTKIYRFAIATPKRILFDYLPNESSSESYIPILGNRFHLPFGTKKRVGFLIDINDSSQIKKIKHAGEPIDTFELIPSELLQLIIWSSNYYQYSLGLCLNNILPKKIRKGDAISHSHTQYHLSPEGENTDETLFKNARHQKSIMSFLYSHSYISLEDFKKNNFNKTALNALLKKKFITKSEHRRGNKQHYNTHNLLKTQPPELNTQQQDALASILSINTFSCYLLEGVTGSGKTEVYSHAIAAALQRGQQALVLTPEIGLTPQLLTRFHKRFNCPIVTLHSNLNDTERTENWLKSHFNEAAIIIGTRSAIFTPFTALGIIIVDEEHDLSYKQQEKFHYHARDVAIRRAQQLNIPIILGSATPSMESLLNCEHKFTHLKLTERANAAHLPSLNMIDIRNRPLKSGFSAPVINAINNTLKQNQHVLIFINRRGYASSMICHQCGWIAECTACDTRLTVHKKIQKLRCHYCLHQEDLIRVCPQCLSNQLKAIGSGTEQSEEFLTQLYPTTKILRIDRDSMKEKHAMKNALSNLDLNMPTILVGTQMLAKGHHLPSVTLVVILNSDSILFSNDFRNQERIAQLMTQVSGRSGRSQLKGSVLIQTHLPDHPFWSTWLKGGYQAVSKEILDSREQTKLPPFHHICLIKMDYSSPQLPISLLEQVHTWLSDIHPQLDILGPFPANLTKRANRFRFLLQIKHSSRKTIHSTTIQVIKFLETHKPAQKTRWNIDIDPQEF